MAAMGRGAWRGMERWKWAERGGNGKRVVDVLDMLWVGGRMANGLNWRKLAEIIDKSQLFFGWRTPRYAPWLNLAKFGPVWHTMAKPVFVGVYCWTVLSQ